MSDVPETQLQERIEICETCEHCVYDVFPNLNVCDALDNISIAGAVEWAECPLEKW